MLPDIKDGSVVEMLGILPSLPFLPAHRGRSPRDCFPIDVQALSGDSSWYLRDSAASIPRSKAWRICPLMTSLSWSC